MSRSTTEMPVAVRWLLALSAILCIFLAMDSQRLLSEQPLMDFVITVQNHYYYALLGLLLPLSFLVFPPFAKARRYWYDIILSLVTFGICAFFFFSAETMLDYGWEFAAPTHAVWMAYALWALTLEAVRRCGGTTLFGLVLVFSVYPVFAELMPGPISGMSSTLANTASYHVMSIESILGLPFRAFAQLVIGFLIFGVALQHTGGGRFFINLAFALFGHVRGGSAKVAIVSSGLMGSMSGSVITNVLTTGQMTIPAMKKDGMSPAYAGGVEACASTGGVLLPPIMGSTAFVMATFLNVPYTSVALAAAIPALLYFFGLFVQVDAYAARTGLKGTPREQLPKLGETFRDGWYYIASFAVLIFLLIVMQREAAAPYFATGMLLALNQLSRVHRWNLAATGRFLVAAGRLLVELLAIMAGVGLIVGALSVTGLSGTLVNDLLYLAGDSIWLLLLMGALTSFVLGIGMTVTAAYIFLAIVLAPALVQGGLSPMSVHLFILYWGMLSFITPPVALGAFAAASIAGASSLTTGFKAMRLGSVIYFIPFFFVLDPALILEASWWQVITGTTTVALGIVLIAGALQDYLPGLGFLDRTGVPGTGGRLLTGLGGILVALPGLETFGLAVGDATLLGAGVLLSAVGILLCRRPSQAIENKGALS
ncbi:TRAP transporter fused permease subunit [Pseudohongiella sp. SYSU M77423]|uniref:TRAP transporter permease n=1 Tax=unclassified Pseudohongiella TaxID=2629611 RepID=UPI001F012A80|nr:MULTISPECIES: TRAP transporter fused permease subunit [unclassified Pseudohongiella]MDH7943981.1 TRAP transporter fused permease subunit [Pseudohongiella sp. SYSU M77423]